jgi:hypothetical protein
MAAREQEADVIGHMAGLGPGRGGPRRPAERRVSPGWLGVALVSTVGAALCWIEFGAWRFGYHTISFTAQQRAEVRWSVLALIVAGALAVSRLLAPAHEGVRPRTTAPVLPGLSSDAETPR